MLSINLETFQENIEPNNPLLLVDVISTDTVKELVNPVHKNIISHVTIIV
jgi:hypothetical protein